MNAHQVFMKRYFFAIDEESTELFWSNPGKWRWQHRFMLFGGKPKNCCTICDLAGHNKRTCENEIIKKKIPTMETENDICLEEVVVQSLRA